jgi:hypothetical protein
LVKFHQRPELKRDNRKVVRGVDENDQLERDFPGVHILNNATNSCGKAFELISTTAKHAHHHVDAMRSALD